MPTLLALPNELLESILVELPAGKVLAMRRVCKTFHGIIMDSRSIRRNIFLEDAESGDATITPPTLNPALTANNRNFMRISYSQDTRTLRVTLNPFRVPVRLLREIDRAGTPDVQMGMLLSQPSWPAYVYIDGHLLGRFAAGVRFGEVMEAFWEFEWSEYGYGDRD